MNYKGTPQGKIYLNSVISQIPRLLGLLDRNPLSATYGCFDRDYWHYKHIDFPCARKQEAVLTLALLSKIKDPSNPFYANKIVKEWIDAGLKYWCKIQDKNGSFSEWYPHENSFVATAFSSYAVSECLLITGNKDKGVMDALIKAGRWLTHKDELRATNQLSGAALALYNIYLLTKKQEFRKDTIQKINKITRSQNTEGWFNEYGGADIGYLSLTVDYLSKLSLIMKQDKLDEVVTKSIDFLVYFIHPNFTSGGEYGSRNTEYLIPAGFEIMAHKNKNAAILAGHIREAQKRSRGVSVPSLDDRYLTYILYTWLQAYIHSKRLPKQTCPYKKSFDKHFNQAGIVIKSTPYFYSIINYKKNSLKVFFKRSGQCLYDSGILFKYRGTTYSSDIMEDKLISNTVISISGGMSALHQELLSPQKNIMIRGFQSTMGRSNIIGSFIKKKLRDKLISDVQKSHIRFKRELIFHEGIQIKDTLLGIEKIDALFLGTKYSSIYTPSSRYFEISEINNKPFVLSERKVKDCTITIARDYDKNGKLLRTRIM